MKVSIIHELQPARRLPTWIAKHRLEWLEHITVIGKSGLVLGLTAVLIFFVMALSPSSAQDSAPKSEGAPVMIGDTELFVVRAPRGSNNPTVRAHNASSALQRLLRDPDFAPENLAVVEAASETDIVAGDTTITSITEDDARAAGATRASLAEGYLEKIRTELSRQRAQNSVKGALEDASVDNISRTFMQLLFEPLTLKVITAFIGATIIASVVAVVRKSVSKYVGESAKRYASRKIVDFVGCFVAVVFLIVVFRDALGNLAIIVGAATAGIAFALKEVIVSLAGWVAVTFGDFYKVGDRIQLGGIKGDVIDIGFGRTTLMELGEWVNGDLYTGRLVRVSNSNVFSDPFFNYSGDFPYLWDEIVVPVKYGSDAAFARQVLLAIAQEVSAEFVADAQQYWQSIETKYLVENAQTAPMVTLMLNDNWIEFTVRYVVHYRRRRFTKDAFFTRLLEELNKSENRFSLGSATIQLVEAPAFQVQLAQPGAAQSSQEQERA